LIESGWERAPHQHLPPQRIKDIATQAFPKEVLRTNELVTTGHANTNYKLTFQSGLKALLRVHVRDSQGVAREAAITKLVSQTVPVPALIIANEEDDWSVWEWIDGDLLEHSPDQFAEVAAGLGQVLAAIGRHRFDAAGFLDSSFNIDFKFDEACQAYVDRMRQCLGMPIAQERLGDLAPQTNKFINANQHLLDPYRNACQLVHADYKASNLLIRGGKVAGVLDWEFAHSGSPLLDIAILFRHRDSMPPNTLENFQKGFEEAGGFLDSNWRQATRYLDLVSLLDFLSRENLGPKATKDVLGLIAGTTS
jgi:aminoglycoside phosphotransferase (APT) family kinase protein